MNTAPTFVEPLLQRKDSKINSHLWQSILDHYDRKEYEQTFLGLLNYIDKDIVKKYGKDKEKRTTFQIPHGSFTINLSIKNGIFSVKAPFLVLPSGSSLALLRQVAEINFSVLTLSQLVLRGNQLFFEYECPVELMEPFKIYGLLEDICSHGDFYGELFKEKFKAKSIEIRKEKPLTRTQKTLAWKKFQEYLKELFEYLDFFESKRNPGFAWDIFLIQIMKIDYTINPQGFLRSEIEECMVTMNNEKMPLNEVMEKGKNVVKKWKSMDQKKFESCLYVAKNFIPSKKRCDLGCTQNMLKKDYERAKNEISGGGHMGATLSLLYGIYYLYYGNEIQAKQRQILDLGLKSASGTTWKKAAEALWKAVSTVMETKIRDGSKL